MGVMFSLVDVFVHIRAEVVIKLFNYFNSDYWVIIGIHLREVLVLFDV